jgi:ATP-dependent DNA helicase MPH1
MNWNKAREAYNDVQRSIVRGEQLEFYNDVERLLPDHVKPECLEMVMEIEEYSRPTTEKSREDAIQEPSKKRKRNNDPTRDIPPGACTGFVSVADLLVKQKVKRRKKTTKFDEHAGLDDNTDEEIEAGLFAPRRAASTSATFAKPPKTKLKRAKTTVDGSKKRRSASNKAKAPKAAGNTELTLSQMGAEDSDDMEIEKGLWNNSPPSPPKPSPAVMRSSPDVPLVQNRSIIEICTSAAPSRSPSPSNKNGYPTPSRTSGEDPASEHLSPSPPKSPVGPSDVVTPEPEHDIALDAKEPETVAEDDSLAWLLADSDDAEALASSPIAPRRRRTGSQASDAIEIEDSEPENGSPIVLTSSPVGSSGPPKVLPYRDMPPPAVPLPRLRLGLDAPPILVAPSPSLPVRASGRRTKKNLPSIAQIADSSSPLQPPPPSQKRLHRRHHSPHDDSDPDPDSQSNSNSNSPRPPSPPKKKWRAGSGRRLKRLKVRDTAAAARLIPWIDVEAGHSGDEVSGGGDGASSSRSDEGEEEPESESDRRFAGDFLATQASPSYDQSAVYRRSLLSQAPVGAGGRRNDGLPLSVPVFAAPPVRRGGAPLGRIAAAPGGHERIARSSSPAPTDEEDYYILGSFVVDDDAEISFTQSSDP